MSESPAFQALTFDSFGVMKATVCSGKQGELPQYVKRWGEPDTKRCVLTTSINDGEHGSLLAIARKNGLVEVLSPADGEIRVSIPNACQAEDAIVGLHLMEKKRKERSCTLLICTTNGHVSKRSVKFPNSPGESTFRKTSVLKKRVAGNMFCSKMHGTEDYAVCGGKGFKATVWNLKSGTEYWKALSRSPVVKDDESYTPTWITSAAFLNNDGPPNCFVAGTNTGQICLYDTAEREPPSPFPFEDSTPIKSLVEDGDGNIVYVANGSGDLGAFDRRKGGYDLFKGKCSGSIRTIVRHPRLPIIASCGLDCYLRIWDIKTRQFLSEVYLDHPLEDVVFDSQYKGVEVQEERVTRKCKKSKKSSKGGAVEEE